MRTEIQNAERILPAKNLCNVPNGCRIQEEREVNDFDPHWNCPVTLFSRLDHHRLVAT